MNENQTNPAFGGTEIMMERLVSSVPADLLSNFQIILTRLNEPLDESKIRVLWVHDLAEDPQLSYLKDEGWRKFHLIVFVSNWQMQSFINRFGIPWSKCMVIQNSIEPIVIPPTKHESREPTDEVRLIYTPTPHRGLNILVPVFIKLLERYPNLKLDVYSSFKLYGWDGRDKEFEPLFNICREHPSINYHGTVSNEVIRAELPKADIFAYPSIYLETSCLCLIEAMSAGLICVHPNLGALYETASNVTYMYQFHEVMEKHASTFYGMLDLAIQHKMQGAEFLSGRMANQKNYTDQVYNWNNKKVQWEAILNNLLSLPRKFEAKSAFTYDTGY